MNWLRFVEQNSYEMENFERLNKDNSDNMQVDANVTFQLYDVYKCSKFECQSTHFLGTKILDDFEGVDVPVSVSVQERETRHWPDSLSTPIEDRM